MGWADGSVRRGVLLLGAVVAVGMLVTGCSSSGSSTPTLLVRTAKMPGIGQILEDGAGYALYVYLPDDRGSSRCTLACASEWPPLVLPKGVRSPTAGPGVDRSLLGTVRRTDGDLQVTYNHWPLYTYIDDGPGQATGQGAAMGAWYLISPPGNVVRELPSG